MSKDIDTVIRQTKDMDRHKRNAVCSLTIWQQYLHFAIDTLSNRCEWGHRLSKILLIAVVAMSLASFVAVVVSSSIEWYHLLLNLSVAVATGTLAFVNAFLLNYNGTAMDKFITKETNLKASIDQLHDELGADTLEANTYKFLVSKTRNILDQSDLRYSNLRTNFYHNLGTKPSQAALKIVATVLGLDEDSKHKQEDNKKDGKDNRWKKDQQKSKGIKRKPTRGKYTQKSNRKQSASDTEINSESSSSSCHTVSGEDEKGDDNGSDWSNDSGDEESKQNKSKQNKRATRASNDII
jgi:hypothetical protein